MRQMEKDGLIQKSLSEWASPVMMVAKHDGARRMVCDLRKVNAVLRGENFDTMTLREIVEKVGGTKSKVFSLIDLRAAYNQIVVDKESRKFIAFVCPLGSYEFKRLPFGLRSSGSIFNYIISLALSSDEILCRNVITYIDDLFIFTDTVEQHIDVMRRLFVALRAANLKNSQ